MDNRNTHHEKRGHTRLEAFKLWTGRKCTTEEVLETIGEERALIRTTSAGTGSDTHSLRGHRRTNGLKSTRERQMLLE